MGKKISVKPVPEDAKGQFTPVSEIPDDVFKTTEIVRKSKKGLDLLGYFKETFGDNYGMILASRYTSKFYRKNRHYVFVFSADGKDFLGGWSGYSIG